MNILYFVPPGGKIVFNQSNFCQIVITYDVTDTARGKTLLTKKFVSL